MTFFHFVNCVLLTFLPTFVVFKGTDLNDYREYLSLLKAAGYFIASQLSKLLLIATFAPSSAGSESVIPDVAKFLWFSEVIKSLIGLLDIFFMQRALQDIRSECVVRLLTLGVGWSIADSLTGRFFPLWMNARSFEFDWQYLFIAVDANIQLLFFIVFATAVWLSRKEPKAHQMSIALAGGLPFLVAVADHLLAGFGPLYPRLVHGGLVVGSAIFVHRLFKSHRN